AHVERLAPLEERRLVAHAQFADARAHFAAIDVDVARLAVQAHVTTSLRRALERERRILVGKDTRDGIHHVYESHRDRNRSTTRRALVFGAPRARRISAGRRRLAPRRRDG